MKKKTTFFFFTFFLIFLFVFVLLFHMNQKIKPKIEEYAEYELKKFNTLIINQTIMNEINEISLDQLFFLSKSEQNEIHAIDFNSLEVNRYLSLITNRIQTNFQALEKGDYDPSIFTSYDNSLLRKGIAFTIPIGMVSNNFFLSNLGPEIPVRFHLMGDIVSNVETQVTNYGINNALIQVMIHVTISERMILPFFSKNIQTSIKVPIIMKLIEGKVPNYYFSGLDKNSNIFTYSIQ